MSFHGDTHFNPFDEFDWGEEDTISSKPPDHFNFELFANNDPALYDLQDYPYANFDLGPREVAEDGSEIDTDQSVVANSSLAMGNTPWQSDTTQGSTPFTPFTPAEVTEDLQALCTRVEYSSNKDLNSTTSPATSAASPILAQDSPAKTQQQKFHKCAGPACKSRGKERNVSGRFGESFCSSCTQDLQGKRVEFCSGKEYMCCHLDFVQQEGPEEEKAKYNCYTQENYNGKKFSRHTTHLRQDSAVIVSSVCKLFAQCSGPSCTKKLKVNQGTSFNLCKDCTSLSEGKHIEQCSWSGGNFKCRRYDFQEEEFVRVYDCEANFNIHGVKFPYHLTSTYGGLKSPENTQ